MKLSRAQHERLKEAQQELQQLGAWAELTQQEQSSTLAQVEDLAIEPPNSLAGIKQLLNQEYAIQARVRQLRQGVEHLAAERRRARGSGAPHARGGGGRAP